MGASTASLFLDFGVNKSLNCHFKQAARQLQRCWKPSSILFKVAPPLGTVFNISKAELKGSLKALRKLHKACKKSHKSLVYTALKEVESRVNKAWNISRHSTCLSGLSVRGQSYAVFCLEILCFIGRKLCCVVFSSSTVPCYRLTPCVLASVLTLLPEVKLYSLLGVTIKCLQDAL